MQHRVLPYLVLFLGVLSVSFSAPLIRLSHAPSPIIAFYRLFITCSILAPLTLWREKDAFQTISKKDLKLALLSGLALAAHFIFWISSVHHTSVASATVLVNTNPIIVVILSYFLWRETPHALTWPGALTVLAGIAMLSRHDLSIDATHLLGDILALAGALSVAVYFLLGRVLRQQLSLGLYTTIVYGSATFFLFIYSLLMNYPFYPYSKIDWFTFAGLAIISTIGGHTSLNWCLKYLPASTVSIGVLGEPAIASVLAWVFLSEPLSLQQMLAGTCILTGIGWFIYWQTKPRNPLRSLSPSPNSD